MKWVFYILAALGLAFGWYKFATSGEDKIEEINEQIVQIENEGYQDEMEKIPALRDKIEEIKGGKTLQGILFAFLSAGLIGVLFVFDVLPLLAHKVTHAVYDSGEEAEPDPLAEAHSKVAQGDFEGAVESLRAAAANDPLNRIPWVEMAKIQRENLKHPDDAIATLRTAIEGQEWQERDVAFLMFRLAELYDEDKGDRMSAVTIMQQVIEMFPETRHSANARHKLHEWGVA